MRNASIPTRPGDRGVDRKTTRETKFARRITG